ncbi:unnamed protein product [Lota lota]
MSSGFGFTFIRCAIGASAVIQYTPYAAITYQQFPPSDGACLFHRKMLQASTLTLCLAAPLHPAATGAEGRGTQAAAQRSFADLIIHPEILQHIHHPDLTPTTPHFFPKSTHGRRVTAELGGPRHKSPHCFPPVKGALVFRVLGQPDQIPGLPRAL